MAPSARIERTLTSVGLKPTCVTVILKAFHDDEVRYEVEEYI